MQKIMNTKPKLKIQPAQPITIELETEIVTAIVADYFNRRFNAEIPIRDEDQILANSLQEQIVREHLAARTKRQRDDTNRPLTRNIKQGAKKPSKCPNNPKPRAERLTNAYVGNPADFETTAASISAQLQNTIHQVLSMRSVDRAKRYSGALRLHAFSHEKYKWYATICKKVTGTPIRRFFADLKGAVTWLEVVRDRWLVGNLKHNLPLGGVSRNEFQMPLARLKNWRQPRPSEAGDQDGGWNAEQPAPIAVDGGAARQTFGHVARQKGLPFGPATKKANQTVRDQGTNPRRCVHPDAWEQRRHGAKRRTHRCSRVPGKERLGRPQQGDDRNQS